MKLIIRKIISLFFLTVIGILFVFPQKKSAQDTVNQEGSIPIDTCKFIFYLDGKRTSAMSTLGQMQNGTVIYKAGYGDPKNAIFYCGEKARKGILIFETKNSDDMEGL